MNQSLLVSFFLLGAITLTSSMGPEAPNNHDRSHHGGIVIRGRNRLGENEVRVRYGKYHALEVTMPKLGESGMYYRQVTDGRHFLENVFQGRDNLIDCDMNRDKDEVRKFLDDFMLAESAARRRGVSGGNVTVSAVLGRKDLDKTATEMIDVASMRTSCKVLHRRQRQLMRAANQGRTEHQSEHSRKANHQNAFVAFSRLRGQERPLEAATTTTTTLRGDRKSTRTASVSRRRTGLGSSRAKRSFIYPGTNWCGAGNTALDYHDLGDNVATDKCCRGHDHCPYTIGGFTTRYNHFNYRFHTLSHCQCDEMFRSCLRSAANSVADMVGSVYFNVVAMKCFTLRKIEVCHRRSWWGRCIEYKDDYEAEVNEPFQY